MKNNNTDQKLPQTIVGTVLPGLKKGKQLGAATANLDISLAGNLHPGLYSATIILNGKKLAGLLYYGYNSISKKDCLEAHILNFDLDIYGQDISVVAKKFLRPPIKFKNKSEMSEQIKKDINSFKKYA